VTITASITIGEGLSNTDAITCQDTGRFIQNLGTTLTSKGHINADEAELNFNSCNVVFEVGAGEVYRIKSNTYGAEAAHINFNGTANDRCSVSKTGDGDIQITTFMSGNNQDDICNFVATYTDFTGLGNGSNLAIYTRRGGQSFTNCRFDTCYPVGNGVAGYYYPNRDLKFSYCNFENTQGTWDIQCTNGNAGVITGDRIIEYTAMESGFQIFGNWRKTNLVHCSFEDYSHTGKVDSNDDMLSWQYCFIWSTSTDFEPRAALIQNCYRFCENGDNHHVMIFGDQEGIDKTYDGNIIESGTSFGQPGGEDDECDGVIATASQSSAIVVTVINNLVIPNEDNWSSSTLVTDNLNYTETGEVTYIIDKNTCCTQQSGGFQLAAHGGPYPAGAVGQIQSCRSNLMWSFSSPVDAHVIFEPGDAFPINDYVTVADYNAWNYVDTTAYDIDPAVFANTPGANDVENEDPQFVDVNRKLATWSETVLGNTGTALQLRTAAIAAMNAMNDPDASNYHADATVENLVTWVKEGFAPQNQALATSGHDGGRIGAIEIAEVSDTAMMLSCLV
jgi:hypothetical protein